MVYDVQKAGFWKRLSAWFLDVILLLILAVGVALLLSSVLGFDGYFETMESVSKQYEAEAGVSFDITEEAYNALPEEERAKIDEAYTKFTEDPEAIRAYNNLVNLSFLIVSLSLFFSFLVSEFIVSMLFGNGQTLGKKAFAHCVVRIDGVKVTPLQMFVRTVLGKYAVELMILIYLTIYLGISVSIWVILVFGVIESVLMLVTKGNCAIHDLMAGTVVVDYNSQKIFNSPDELIEYQKEIAAEQARRQSY